MRQNKQLIIHGLNTNRHMQSFRLLIKVRHYTEEDLTSSKQATEPVREEEEEEEEEEGREKMEGLNQREKKQG